MFKSQLNLKQIVLSLICSLFIISSICILYHFDYFRRADNILYDLNFRWRGFIEPPSEIVLVLMDDKSALELNRKYGKWSRLQTAKALNNLCQAGAEVIGLDMVMTAPDTDPQKDKALAKAIGQCNNVVLPRISSTQSTQGRTCLDIFRKKCIGEGFIDIPLDADDVLRRLNYFHAKPLADGSLEIIPAFALELVRAYLYLDFNIEQNEKKEMILGNPQGQNIALPQPELLINFYGNYSVFENISYSDVVRNRFDPEKVRGKIIIIGSSLAINKDKYSTPFSLYRHATKSLKGKFKEIIDRGMVKKDLGVACHAHAAATILSQKFLSSIDQQNIVVLIALCGLFGGLFYYARLSVFWQASILISSLGLLLGIGYLLFSQGMLVLDTVPLMAVLGGQFISGLIVQKSFALKKTIMIKNLFGKYVSKKVVDELTKGDMQISFAGQYRELTIFFADLRNFTSISENLSPQEISKLLNTFYDTMLPVMFKHQGTLDKLIGDAIMAFFGAPLNLPGHPILAAECSLELIDTLKKLKKDSTLTGIADLEIGIGLNTGGTTVGNLGSKDFMDYTVIGDTVNTASRLEGLNKVFNTRIIISEATQARLDDTFLVRELDLVQVKGKNELIKIYELYGYKKEAGSEIMRMFELFHSALKDFQREAYKQAESKFLQILEKFPQDGPSKYYLQRITTCLQKD